MVFYMYSGLPPSFRRSTKTLAIFWSTTKIVVFIFPLYFVNVFCVLCNAQYKCKKQECGKKSMQENQTFTISLLFDMLFDEKIAI